MISQDLPLSAQVTSIVFEPFCLAPVHVFLSHFHSILSASFPSPSHVVRLQSLLALGCILWPLEQRELLLVLHIHPGLPELLFHLLQDHHFALHEFTLQHYCRGICKQSWQFNTSRNEVTEKIPESDNSLSIPLSPAPLHSSPQRPMPFSPAHLQMGDARVLNILPSSALSPSKKSDVKVAALRNSQHPSFLCSHQQASLIYLAQCTSRRF